MKVNFYWSGNDFQFLNRLTLLSHVMVGHEVVVWLYGDEPKSIYWISDIHEITIEDATKYLDINMIKGANPRTISTLWSWYHMKNTGEYVADCDAIALKTWPDLPIILASYRDDEIAVGVIRMSKDHPVLDECISKFESKWGNVLVFTDVCRKHGLDNLVPHHWFYPVNCVGYKDENGIKHYGNTSETLRIRGKIFDNVNYPDSYSIHYYSRRVSEVGCDHYWTYDPDLQNSLFKRLSDWVFKKYYMTNEKL